jgi:hypothetical protein
VSSNTHSFLLKRPSSGFVDKHPDNGIDTTGSTTGSFSVEDIGTMRWIVCRNCMRNMVRENQKKQRNANNAGGFLC